MTKKLKGKALVATAALAGATLVGGATTAHADSEGQTNNQQSQITNQTPEEAQAQKDIASAKDNVSSATTKKDSAQSTFDDAQSALNNAQSAADAQKGNVKNASDAVDEATKTVNSDTTAVNDAQKKADEATPENIANAQKSVEDQNTKINSDDQAISDAQAAQKKAQQGVTDAQNAENASNADLQNKKDAASTAQKNYDQASDALKGTHLVEAQNAYDEASAKADAAQKDVDNKQAEVNKASAAVDSAKSNNDAKQTDLSNANNQVATDQSDVATKSNAADAAAAAQDAAQKAVDNTQAQLDKVNKDLQGFAENTIKVTPEMLDALNNYNSVSDNKASTDAEIEAALTKMYSELRKGISGRGLNGFNSSEYDKGIMVDVNNLTPDQLSEINSFAEQLINDARRAFGTDTQYGLVKATTGAISMASEVANGYRADNWHISKGHDVSRITTAAGKMGLDNGGNYYEDAGEGFIVNVTGKNTISMDQLKESIYNSITAMLFDDSNSGNGHMSSLLGYSASYLLSKHAPSDRVTYFGAAVNMLGANTIGQNHYILIPGDTNYIRNQTTFDNAGGATAMSYVSPQQRLTQEKNSLTNTLSSQTTDLNNKKQANSEAQTALNNANAKLTTDKATQVSAQKAADEASNNLASAKQTLSNLQSELVQLNTALTAANQQKQNAKATLDSYTADHQQKLINFNNAKTALTSANKAVSEANTALQAAQTTTQKAKDNLKQKEQAVSDAQAALNQDKQQLASLQKNLTDLQNAPQILQAAKDKLAKDQANLQSAQTKLANEQATQDSLDAKVTDAQGKVNSAKKALANAQSALAAAQAQLTSAQDHYALVHSDSYKYGKNVRVKTTTMQAGAALPDPVIDSGVILNGNGSANGVFVSLASVDTNTLPAGTRASWANRSKALADSQNAGTYSEDVLITFPDGTTTTVKGELMVSPRPATPRDTALDGGYHIVNGQVVDANGNPVAGWYVNSQGQMVSPDGTVVNLPASGITTTSATAVNSGQQTKTLPQTSNANNSLKELGFISLAIASALSLFGLGKRQHN